MLFALVMHGFASGCTDFQSTASDAGDVEDGNFSLKQTGSYLNYKIDLAKQSQSLIAINPIKLKLSTNGTATSDISVTLDGPIFAELPDLTDYTYTITIKLKYTITSDSFKIPFVTVSNSKGYKFILFGSNQKDQEAYGITDKNLSIEGYELEHKISNEVKVLTCTTTFSSTSTSRALLALNSVYTASISQGDTPDPSTSTPTPTEKGKMGAGEIIAIIFCVILAIVLIIVIIYFVCCNKRNRSQKKESSSLAPPPEKEVDEDSGSGVNV